MRDPPDQVSNLGAPHRLRAGGPRGPAHQLSPHRVGRAPQAARGARAGARMLTSRPHCSLKWYPPATAVVRPSRLNGIGQVCFYGSNMPNAALLELRPQPRHVFTVVITLSSIHVTVALIVLIEKIVATMALIAAQEVEISLVEHDPEQIVIYARRHPERTFHHVDLCASPLDHEHK